MKRIAFSALLGLASASMLAGGLFTNTNQNPIFFRQPAQNAVIGVQGAYYNPAGLVFMNEGLHIGLGNQLAIQSREIQSTYAPFAMNASAPGQSTRTYKGETFSPVIPSIDLAYNKNDWAASLHFGVVSGGGSCSFDNGLGSFEAPMALLPVAVNAIAGMNGLPAIIGGYNADINFTGKSFGFGGQFNFSYKVIDIAFAKLSLSAGLRLNYLKNDYSGGIFNYQLYMNSLNTMVPANQALGGILSQLGIPEATAQAYAQQLGGDKEVACVQTAYALNPIVSAHFKSGILDFAVKYEFLTKVELENSTSINTANIAAYTDGAKVRADIPALLSAGLNLNILPSVRAAAAMNIYFDKDANYNGRQDKLGSNTLEWTAGLEFDLNDKLTASIGTQVTRFDFGENNDYLTDSSFSLPSWCLCGGFRYWLTNRLAVDLSAFNTFYDTATKQYADYGGAGATYSQALGGLGIPESALSMLAQPGTDEFKRTSLSFGLGIVLDF